MKIKENSLIFWAFAFVLILPVLILPPTFQPSDWTRALLFRTTLALLLGWVGYRFFYKRNISFEIPKKGWIFWLPLGALGAYIFINIIAAFFSQDTMFSMFGSPARSGGVLTLAFFFLLSAFAAIFIKGTTWQKLLRVNFIAGTAASLLAMIQYFGLFKNIFLGFETGATPSFLGNSTFLAIYMIFLVFSAFSTFLVQSTQNGKLRYGGIFFLFLFTVFATGSRASFLAVIFGFLFYALFYPKKLAQEGTRLIGWITPKKLLIFKMIAIAGIAFVMAIVAYVNLVPGLPGFIENNPRLSYFAHNRLSIPLLVEDLTGTRLSAWKITWESIKEKPWLGWGPENSYIGFEKYFDPTLPPSLQRLWFDRPHNIVLEVWANAGVFALIAFAAFWIILLWQLQVFKRRQHSLAEKEDKENIHIAHSLQAMCISYLIALLVNFDSFSTYLISFFFIGYALYVVGSTTQKAVVTPKAAPLPLAKPIYIISTVGLAMFLLFWNVKPLYLGEKILVASNAADAKQCNTALKIADSSNWAKAGILAPYAITRYSDVVLDCVYAVPQKEVEYSQKALDLLKVAAKKRPAFSRTWYFMGSFANVLAAREKDPAKKAAYLQEAKEYIATAMEWSPKRQELMMEIEKTYFLEQDFEAIKKTAQECIAIDSSQGTCYWYLGVAEIFMGNQELGNAHIAASKTKNNNDPIYLQLGIAYLSQGNYKDAAPIYKILTDIYPKNPSFHAVLATIYTKLGDYERAAMETEAVFLLQPGSKEALDFMRAIVGASPNDVNVREAVARIYKHMGDTEKYFQEINLIVSLYKDLIARFPAKARLHIQLGKAYLELGEYEKVLNQARSAFSKDQSTANDAYRLVLLVPNSNDAPYYQLRTNIAKEIEPHVNQ